MISLERIDERDTMFARAHYKKDSTVYKDYYAKNPKKKDIDDSFRTRPELLEEGTTTYNALNSPIAGSAFAFLGDIKDLCEGEVSSIKIDGDNKIFTKKIKGIASLYGACMVGITKLEKKHIYTHKGRCEEDYGQEVKLDHKFAIAFACEMDIDMVNRAPMISEVIATSKSYVDVAIIGMIISYYIRSLGYEARNHVDANYLVMPALIAEDAGLGQIGRNAILTNKDYGSRFKLGVVTTNLPLDIDEKTDFGLEDFCKVCKKCALTCPTQSLSRENKISKDNKYNWTVDVETCYEKWRYLGTDCGMCISVCPFSQNLESVKKYSSFKKNGVAIQDVLDEYKKKFGTRVFVPGNPSWLR
ncbi:4Fe-4S dicluster domain-containing protein [Terrisporobacter petrolearius]|uniref:4Fe-4S dicluster domain-containing protein n=1 Tax=Terrisporobacter petrolearius TaxID=1460447 RepID=UPI003B00F17C